MTVQPKTALGIGIHLDVEAAFYHSDPCSEPSLSSSIARLLINKTPRHAMLAHPRLNPEARNSPTAAMNLGSITHEILLGNGAGFEVCPYDDYKTAKAREWRDSVVLSGKTPIKDDDLSAAIAMANAVHAAVAGIPGVERAIIAGDAEAVIIWRDDGPLCRARLDWLDLDVDPAIYDLKTTAWLDDRSLNARIARADTAFDMRAAFYLRGIGQLMPDLAGRIAYRWIFVESEAPFEVRVFELNEITRGFGDRKVKYAIDKWRTCLSENCWPGYARKIELPSYPAWAETAWLDRELEEAMCGAAGETREASVE